MKTNQERMQEMKRRLEDALSPSEIRIDDDSHLHAGHAGAKSGKGHFTLHIASDAFSGLRPIACHQKVYQALGELMQTDIHALSIKLL